MTGTLYGLGVGPGDPELLTLKAHRILKASPVVAYPAPDTGQSYARSIVAGFLRPEQVEIAMVVPMRSDRLPARGIYDEAAAEIAEHLEQGRDVAVLCEGDPFFYGSFMYLFERLGQRYRCEIVPGVSSVMAASAALGKPLAARNDVLTVIPGPLDDDELQARIVLSDAVAIMKVGRHFGRLRTLVGRLGLADAACYCERVSLGEERIMPLSAFEGDSAPYFSMILIYRGAEDWIRALPARTTGKELNNV